MIMSIGTMPFRKGANVTRTSAIDWSFEDDDERLLSIARVGQLVPARDKERWLGTAAPGIRRLLVLPFLAQVHLNKFSFVLLHHIWLLPFLAHDISTTKCMKINIFRQRNSTRCKPVCHHCYTCCSHQEWHVGFSVTSLIIKKLWLQTWLQPTKITNGKLLGAPTNRTTLGNSLQCPFKDLF